MVEIGKLKVCFLAGTLGQGGAERQLVYILKTLREHGTKLRLLCLTRGEFWERPIRELGIPVIWVGQSASRAARLARIVKELREERPEIVQSQHFYTNLYATVAGQLLRIREIGAMRNDGLSEVRSHNALLGRLSLLGPRIMAANSQAAIRNAVALGVASRRVCLLPNVVDPDHFKPIRPRSAGLLQIVTIGRLVDQKRMDRFLSVVARVKEQFDGEVKGVIVGDGPERVRLERQAIQLGLVPEVVEFRGSVSDTAPLYRQADIFVLTSDWEGMPNVILEAMASGLPVVATGVGGVPEIVRHGETGFLVDPGDEGGMVDAILTLIKDRDLRLQFGRAGREFVLAHHSLDKLPGYLQKLYELALA